MREHSTLADRLKALRGDRGQQEVADAVGVSRSYLSGIEGGHDMPGFDSFVALADYYGVSLDWLAKGGPAHKPRETALIEFFRTLTETEQDFVLVAMEALAHRARTPESRAHGRTGTGG